MSDLLDLLDQYPALLPDERAAVDARAAAAPECAAAHREARAFAALLDAAGPGPPEDEAAWSAVDRRMGRHAPDAPRLGAEADRVEARLDALEAGMEDPVARFQARTGLTLPPARARTGTKRTALGSGGAGRRPGPARWVTALAAGAVVYGGLMAVSATKVPPRAQVAALGEVRMERAGAESDAPDADALGPALDAVRAARRSRFGLFPHYDAAALDSAAVALAEVAGRAAPASWVSQEARLALGRVHLYRARDAQAVRVLSGLVAEGGYRASAARRLVDFVRVEGRPVPPPRRRGGGPAAGPPG